MKLAQKALALALLSALILTIVLWPEIPRWRIGGTQSMLTGSVSSPVQAGSCPRSNAKLAILGDSHVAGGRMGSEGLPFGKVLERELDRGIEVELYGAGGETAEGSNKRWRMLETDAALVIIAYGTNDAAPRGWLRDKTPVPIARFTKSLQNQMERWQSQGRDILLLAPPPAGSAAIMKRLQPYREATGDLGQTLGAPVIDPADAFAACHQSEPFLVYDALHMNADGHECLGRWLAKQLCPSAN